MSQTGQTYTFAGQPLTCPICKHSYFEQENALLKDAEPDGAYAGAAQFGAENNLDTYICTVCGYILWFLFEEIDQPGETYRLFTRPLQCSMCQETTFSTRETLMSTRSATFMQFNWSKPSAIIYVCTHCGSLKWFLGEEVGRLGQTYNVAGRQLSCRSCGKIAFRERETLMTSRNATFESKDWIDQSTHNYICTTCGSIHWFI